MSRSLLLIIIVLAIICGCIFVKKEGKIREAFGECKGSPNSVTMPSRGTDFPLDAGHECGTSSGDVVYKKGDCCRGVIRYDDEGAGWTARCIYAQDDARWAGPLNSTRCFTLGALSSDMMNRADAQAYCQNMGGNLATIGNEIEDRYVSKFAGTRTEGGWECVHWFKGGQLVVDTI